MDQPDLDGQPHRLRWRDVDRRDLAGLHLRHGLPGGPDHRPRVSRTGTGAYAATAAGNDRTSCAFAVATQRAYLAAGGSGDATTVTAYSQARGSDVRLLCTGDQPVRCVSSTGALVFLYGGEAVLG